MKIILSIILFCSLLLADRDGGPYIGLGYGLSKYDDDTVYKEQKIDDSESIIVYAGAYINKHLSVEVGYVDFNFEESYTAIDKANAEVSLNFSSINVSTLAHYAFFDDVLDFYGKFGVGEASASGVDANGFTMIYGGGIGVRFSDRLSMKVAYDRYIIDYNEGLIEYEMHVDIAYAAFEVQF